MNQEQIEQLLSNLTKISIAMNVMTKISIEQLECYKGFLEGNSEMNEFRRKEHEIALEQREFNKAIGQFNLEEIDRTRFERLQKEFIND